MGPSPFRVRNPIQIEYTRQVRQSSEIQQSAYAVQASWDIGKPQKAIIDVADQITGSGWQQS